MFSKLPFLIFHIACVNKSQARGFEFGYSEEMCQVFAGSIVPGSHLFSFTLECGGLEESLCIS